MRTTNRSRSLWAAVVLAAAVAACGFGDAVAQRAPGPSRVPVGELARSAWLPAGLDELRFDDDDQARLAALGLSQIQWLQRAERDGQSAEALAMAFCARQGLTMPVYYEPPGFSPYDKLHNLAARPSRPADFEAQVRARVAALQTRWAGQPGFAGYLVGHEDYRAQSAMPAFVDPSPSFTGGNITRMGSYYDLDEVKLILLKKPGGEEASPFSQLWVLAALALLGLLAFAYIRRKDVMDMMEARKGEKETVVEPMEEKGEGGGGER